MDSKQIIRDEMEFQQRRFYRRLKINGELVVEYWLGAKLFLESIPGITWKKQGNKILIKDSKREFKIKTFRDILNEAAINPRTILGTSSADEKDL